MLIFYHAPMSRSTSVLALIHEMGIEDRVDIRKVGIRRGNGTGTRDADNPHPFAKVPCLQDGDDLVYERGAVMLYLTDRFPEAGLGRPVGDLGRGRFISWLFHYQGVIEPLFLLGPQQAQGDAIAYTLRDLDEVTQHIDQTLDAGPWLLGDRYSAADLLIGGMFNFAKGMGSPEPRQQRIRDWLQRCDERPASRQAKEEDQQNLSDAK